MSNVATGNRCACAIQDVAIRGLGVNPRPARGVSAGLPAVLRRLDIAVAAPRNSSERGSDHLGRVIP